MVYCVCPYCGGEIRISNPYEAMMGKLKCPHCQKLSILEEELSINEDNQEESYLQLVKESTT